MLNTLILPLSAIAAVLLDHLLGEPKRWHPLVGFGRLAAKLEEHLNTRTRISGIAALLVLIVPFVAVAYWLSLNIPIVVDVLLLYFSLGAKSLTEHAEAVQKPLLLGNLVEARHRVGWMVSRDTTQLGPTDIATAGVESVLENGNDAVFGTVFWFILFGGPGALLFRLANTLDAMWGYKTHQYQKFGWAAARFDDLLNWPAARLTALTYALLGRTSQALSCWKTQGRTWESPNAGPVMASGAGALSVILGGEAYYLGKREVRPLLGAGDSPSPTDIGRAVVLVKRGLWLWLVIFLAVGVCRA